MRCRFLFKTEDHPFFLWSHSNNYQRPQWGAIGKATWLISLKLRLNQKWISSCKKVYLPKYIMSKFSKSLKLFEKRCNVILIWMFFAMLMIFHNFEVISDNNCGGPDNEIRKSIKLSGVWIKKYANILGPWHWTSIFGKGIVVCSISRQNTLVYFNVQDCLVPMPNHWKNWCQLYQNKKNN